MLTEKDFSILRRIDLTDFVINFELLLGLSFRFLQTLLLSSQLQFYFKKHKRSSCVLRISRHTFFVSFTLYSIFSIIRRTSAAVEGRLRLPSFFAKVSSCRLNIIWTWYNIKTKAYNPNRGGCHSTSKNLE